MFEIAFLDEEKVKLFKSDFRIVADYFVQMRKTGAFVGSDEELKHVQETLGLLSVMTGDNHFEEVLTSKNGKDIKTMNDFWDKVEARGIAIGEARGEARGRAEALREVAAKIKAGYSIEEILATNKVQ